MELNLNALDAMVKTGLDAGLKLGYGVLIFIIGWWVARRISKVMGALLQKRAIDQTFTLFIKRVIFYILMIFVVLAALSMVGVQTASLVAVLGGMSIAIGLSLRSSLSNLASGILLIFFRPFKVGDYIQVSSETGTVEEIQILFTTIVTSGLQKVIIPNNKFLTNSITNFSANVLRRADIVLGIGYDDDVARAKGIIRDIIQADGRIQVDPEPRVVLQTFADSSVNLLARFFTERTEHFNVIYDFNEAVKKQFDATGISMPYPQQDVHLHKVAAS